MSQVGTLVLFNKMLGAASGRIVEASRGLTKIAVEVRRSSRLTDGVPSLGAIETLLRDRLDVLTPLAQLERAGTEMAERLDAIDGDVRAAADAFEADATSTGEAFQARVEPFSQSAEDAESAVAAAASDFAGLRPAVEQAFDRAVECMAPMAGLAETLTEAATQIAAAAVDEKGFGADLVQAAQSAVASLCDASASLQGTHAEVREELDRFYDVASEQVTATVLALRESLEGTLEDGTAQAIEGLARVGSGMDGPAKELAAVMAELAAWPADLDRVAAHWEGLRDQVASLRAIREVVTYVQQMLANLEQ